MKKILSCLLLILALNLFVPFPSRGTGTVVGEGARSCKEFTKGSRSNKNKYIVWLQGYFSAFNTLVPGVGNVAKGHDYLSITDWLDKYCRGHSEQYFNDAVQALLQEWHPDLVKIPKIVIEVKEE